MGANANGWHGAPIAAADEAKTGGLGEESNKEWRPMPLVPFGLLPKTPSAAKARWVPNPPSPSRLVLGVFGRNAFVPIALRGPSALLGYDDASCMWDRATAE